MRSKATGLIWAASAAVLIAGCASPSRLGMVQQEGTGLQFGSAVENNIVTDASFFPNKKIKIRTRNTSGDLAFGLRRFAANLSDAFESKGYQPTRGDDFGLLLDVNVLYSGQVQSNLANEFAFLGGAGGGLAASAASGGRSVPTLGGMIAGATLGAIIGSYVTDDTYIIVAEVTVGEVKTVMRSKKRITFSRSATTRHEADDSEETNRRGLRSSVRNKVAVYAGGRNVPQSRIADEVRQRIIRIVSDII